VSDAHDKFAANVKAITGPLATRLVGSIRLGRVLLVTDGTAAGAPRQEVQVEIDQDVIESDVPVMQTYGVTSRPKADGNAECLIFALGGRLDDLVAGLVDDGRYRPEDLEEGEVALYTFEDSPEAAGPDKDKRFYFKLGLNRIAKLIADQIVITLKTKAVIDSPEIKLGSDAATQIPALLSELQALKAAVAAWTPVPMDGGASLKPVFSGWAVAGATKVKVE
jgi:phage gp45-like